MVRLTLYACVNDAQRMRKEWGTGDKECWNRWKTIRKQVRKTGRACHKYQNNYENTLFICLSLPFIVSLHAQ